MHGRWRAYPFLVLVGCLLYLPGLGCFSLWDVDEAHNAECAREMLVAENWIVPSFNFVLRTDKPALLYWCMGLAYALLGVGEFAARLPSAVASIGSLLLTYELGRRLFDGRTGLLAAVVLGTSFYFGVVARAATPDALLICSTLASFLVFWHFHRLGSNQWLVWLGATTALAVLAKGLVGFVLPVGIIGLYLAWERRLAVLWSWRLLAGLGLLGLLALPWYVHVGVDTKWEFWRGFFLQHHVARFQKPLEGHGGSMLFHPVAALATFAPWSIFLVLTVYYATGKRGQADAVATPGDAVASYRFLWCWLLVWFTFFSLAGTKLPNYVMPSFPALALLTGRWLTRWQAGTIAPSVRWWGLAMGLLAAIGIGAGVAALMAAGWLAPELVGQRALPRLVVAAPVGFILAATAWFTYRAAAGQQRRKAIVGLCAGVAAFVGLMGGMGPWLVDDAKASRPVCAAVREHQVERETRLGCHAFYQPSLVFYGQRKVEKLPHPDDAVDWLRSKTQVFLFLPASDWEALRDQVPASCVAVARHRDLYSGKDVVVVTNKTRDAVRQVASVP